MGFFAGFFVGVFARPLAGLFAGFCVLLLIGGIIDRVVLGYESEPTGESSARLVRAVDGDTLVVLQDSVEQRVRVLGIDTPEVFGRKECGGEAAARAESSRVLWCRSGSWSVSGSWAEVVVRVMPGPRSP